MNCKKFKQLSELNADQVIFESWNAIRDKIESGVLLSSERTLTFLFAMEIKKQFVDNIVIDFEYKCYDDLEGSSKYLDLLLYTKDDFKVAIEFKLAGSNAAQVRKNIYRDLGRLDYLVNQSISHIHRGYFLLATNQNTYLNNSQIKDTYYTKQNYSLKKNNDLKIFGLNLNHLAVTFNWDNIKKDKNKYVVDGKFAWLKAITFKK